MTLSEDTEDIVSATLLSTEDMLTELLEVTVNVEVTLLNKAKTFVHRQPPY